MARHIFADAAQRFTGYTCAEMRAHYNFPSHLTGKGRVIGVAEWSSGYSQSDLDAFCKLQGLPPCTPQYVVIDGGQNDPDAECTLDIEIAHGMAPDATIRVYEAPSGPDYQTFWDQVIATLRHISTEPSPPDALDISYGDAEANWTKAQVQAVDALIAQVVARGCTVLPASGDQGALGMHDIFADPQGQRNTDAPASCPHAASIGGTSVPPGGGPESAWNDTLIGATGGGISSYFSRPDYQSAVNTYPGRGVPDFSMLADPETGWQIVFQGRVQVIGGTSASAPAAAALIACVNEARAAAGLGPIGDILPTIYAHAEAFVPVTTGDNSFMGVEGYKAAAPWSPCCGLGTPDAAKFVALFLAQAAPASTPATIPIYVDGVEAPAEVVAYLTLKPGLALVPIDDLSKLLGFTAALDPKGVYISVPKAG